MKKRNKRKGSAIGAFFEFLGAILEAIFEGLFKIFD